MRKRISPYQLNIYNNITGLGKLENVWHSITKSCPNLPFYLRYEWYHAYLNCLEKNPEDVFFFLLTKNQKPISIFPLKRQFYNWNGIKLKVWITPRTDEVALADFITLDKDDVIAELKYLLQYLNTTKELNYDGIFLRRIPEGGNAWSLVHDCTIKRKIKLHHSFRKYLKCGNENNGAASVGSTKFKRNLRRLEKRLYTRGSVSWEYYNVESGYEMEKTFESFMDVEASGWKGVNGTKSAIKLNSRVEAFYRELISSFGALGRCRINLLKLNGRVIAAQYCLLDDKRISLLKIGFDQSYSDCSPGYLLVRNVFERGCGAAEFDELSFVTGSSWNDVFHPHKDHVFVIYLLNNTIKGWIFFCVITLKQILKKLIGRDQ